MLPGIAGGIMAALPGGISITWETSPSYENFPGPYSFASVDFGDARADRRIFVAVHWWEGFPHETVSSATIGGVAATIHIQDGHSGGSTGFGCAIISAVVPTGTSGTIVITTSDNSNIGTVGINTFVTYGLASSSPFDTAFAEASGTATDLTDTINVPGGGFVLAVFTSSTNATSKTVTWTGVNEIYDESTPVFNFASVRCSAGISTGLAAETGRTITADVSSNTADAGDAFVAISWN